MKRIRRTHEQWLTIHADWKQSGLSAPAYCESAGISYPSFQNFRKRLERSECGDSKTQLQSPPTFIDLGSLGTPSSSNASGWNIVLRLGNGVELELSQAS